MAVASLTALASLAEPPVVSISCVSSSDWCFSSREFWKSPEGEWLSTCAVITTQASDAVGHIHDRMPLMVPRERWADWLDPTKSGDDRLALLEPAAPGRLEAYPVSTAVGNVRNNGAHLLDPLPLS